MLKHYRFGALSQLHLAEVIYIFIPMFKEILIFVSLRLLLSCDAFHFHDDVIFENQLSL